MDVVICDLQSHHEGVVMWLDDLSHLFIGKSDALCKQ